MEIGIIAPIKFLDKYCITNVQYCLPSLLVENQIYRDFYKKRKDLGNKVIMDCRRDNWKRQPESLSVVERALKVIEPDILILPSYMYNLKRTLEVYKDWKEIFGGYRICGSIEGTNLREVNRCIKFHRDIPYAFPSHLVNTLKEPLTKKALVIIDNHRYLEESYGFGEILVTSLPVRLGLRGRLLSDYLPSPPYLDFYTEEDKFPMVIKRNIEEAITCYGA